MKRIAVIEDNADNRMLVAGIIEDEYEIDEYETAQAGLDGLLASPPDLVLLDISLPDMDGTVIIGKIREAPSLAKLPVIALTAHAMTGDREKYLEAGFDNYMSKPIVDDDALMLMIAQHLADGDG